MLNLFLGQKVIYFGEPCIVIELYDTNYLLQSIKNQDVTYTVNETSRFVETDPVKKHLQLTQLNLR